MKEIERIYFNDFGVAFYWKKQNTILLDKIQLVFKETGLYVTFPELIAFRKLIDDSVKDNCCQGCDLRNNCGKFLLKTPFAQVDLAFSTKELDSIKDLVEGTLFQINLNEFINGVGMN
ncbi:MAG: hypothetical protein V4548_10065 [Bacteroidota bacterium]